MRPRPASCASLTSWLGRPGACSAIRKARRFATEFFGQWLGFYRFDEYRGIDAGRFPEFNDALRAAMYDEAVSFFEHIVREDRPVSEILLADYTFLNAPLAQHYGLDDAADSGGSARSRGGRWPDSTAAACWAWGPC